MLLQRILLLLLVMLPLAQIPAYGQLTAGGSHSGDLQPGGSFIAKATNEKEDENYRILAGRALAALKRLESCVLVYDSLGDFEANGRIARVSFEVFNKTLQEVTAAVEPILSQLPQSKLKMEIGNALYSYRDGGFWWEKVHQARVVNISKSTFTEIRATPSQAVFLSTVPYTVVIHWKQAGKYLQRAGKLTGGKNCPKVLPN